MGCFQEFAVLCAFLHVLPNRRKNNDTKEVITIKPEYESILKNAAPLKVAGLEGDYRQLAYFNGVVFAGHPTRFGTEFITWSLDHDRKGLSHGHYYMDYDEATKDFALRSGLVPEQQLFKPEQLIEIYRCCADTLQDAYDLSYEQEQTIKGIQSQIEDIVPDIMDQIQSQDRQRLEQETQFMK